jgi:hypothetical protein
MTSIAVTRRKRSVIVVQSQRCLSLFARYFNSQQSCILIGLFVPTLSFARLTEEEHEMRSVFVSQLAARIGDRELRQFFENKAGKVREARVITDRISRRSKG